MDITVLSPRNVMFVRHVELFKTTSNSKAEVSRPVVGLLEETWERPNRYNVCTD